MLGGAGLRYAPAAPPSATTQAEGGYLFNDQMGTFLRINLLSPTPQVGTFSIDKKSGVRVKGVEQTRQLIVTRSASRPGCPHISLNRLVCAKSEIDPRDED
jgi:hypothetical protein